MTLHNTSHGNNTIEGSPEVFVNSNINISGENNVIRFGKNFKSKNFDIRIEGNNSSIIFSDNCTITGRVWCVNQSRIFIGKNFKANATMYLTATSGKSILIGENCLFANVIAETTDHHTIFDLNTRQPLNPGANIIIGDRVWCARDVILMKGTILGSDVVVAARSMVNKRFGNKVLIAGCPAGVIKENIAWTEKAEATVMPEKFGVL